MILRMLTVATMNTIVAGIDRSFLYANTADEFERLFTGDGAALRSLHFLSGMPEFRKFVGDLGGGGAAFFFMLLSMLFGAEQ